MMTRKKISDFITKPSEAIDYMINGLTNQSNRKDFEIDMSSFGHSQKKICFGCAATCTLQEMAGIDFTHKTIQDTRRAKHLGISSHEVDEFESGINEFRSGRIDGLKESLQILGINCKGIPTTGGSWYMDTDNWCKYLPAVRKYNDKLKEMGL